MGGGYFALIMASALAMKKAPAGYLPAGYTPPAQSATGSQYCSPRAPRVRAPLGTLFTIRYSCASPAPPTRPAQARRTTCMLTQS